jgi:hypothetical protein
MPRLRRKGLVHEAGVSKSDETGHERILWENNPSAGWRGDDKTIPSVASGPQKPRFRPWTEEEIIEIRKETGGFLDLFVALLNARSEERIY